MLQRFGLLTCAILVLAACARQEVTSEAYDAAHDYFSFANTDQFVTDHLRLDLDVDFESQVLVGLRSFIESSEATEGSQRVLQDAGELIPGILFLF